MLSDLQLQQPLWLLLIPVALLLLLFFNRRGADGQDWSEVCDPELLPLLRQQGQTSLKRNWLPWSLFLAVLLLAVAAAQPVWKKQPQPVFKQSDALVIALDLSASMNATDLKPSRLQRANFKIKDLLNKLPDAEVGFIVYAGDAFAVTPLTEDSDTILASMPAMTPEIMPAQGSRADRALRLADQMLIQANVKGGNILLVSDEVSPAQIAADATRMRKQGRQISILAIGSAAGAPIPTAYGPIKDRQGRVVVAKTDIGLISEAASLGGGQAQLVRVDDRDIDALIAGMQAGEDAAVNADKDIDRWVAEGPWFILLALPFLLPLFRRGFFNIALPLVLITSAGFPQPAHAGLWQDLWKTKDQQGLEAYQQGNKAEAAELFKDQRWQQLAHYDEGSYQQALESLPAPESAADWYNQGNTLARLGELDKAIKAYDKALEQQPQFEDAEHNRQLLQDMLQQQEQQQNQQQDGQGEQQEQSDQQEQEQQSGQQQDQNQQNNSQQSNASEKSAAQDQQDSQPSEQSKKGQQKAQQAQEEVQQQMAEELKKQLDEKLQAEQKQEQEKALQQPSEQPLDETEQSNQQMLNRIQDDPAGLWRRKFIYQYRARTDQSAAEDKQW